MWFPEKTPFIILVCQLSGKRILGRPGFWVVNVEPDARNLGLEGK